MYRKFVTVLSVTAATMGATAHAQVELKSKFTPGEQLSQRSEMKMNQTLTLAGMDIKTSVENEVTSKFGIGKIDADGNLPITVKHEAINFFLSAPGGVELSYDSANPSTETKGIPQLDAIVELLKISTKRPITYLLNSKHKVTQITGIQEMVDGLSPAAKELAKGQLENDRLKEEFEQQYRILPDKPVKKGATWTREETASLGSGQTMTFAKEYTYEGTVDKDGKTLDKISGKASSVEFEQEAGASPLQVTGSDLKVDSSEQTILFSRDTGQIVEMKGDVRIKGTLSLSINGQDLPGQLDLRMQSNAHIE